MSMLGAGGVSRRVQGMGDAAWNTVARPAVLGRLMPKIERVLVLVFSCAATL